MIAPLSSRSRKSGEKPVTNCFGGKRGQQTKKSIKRNDEESEMRKQSQEIDKGNLL